MMTDKTGFSCHRCTLFNEQEVHWQFPDNPQYNIMFIGMGPGQVEAITGVPFTGPAGKMMFRLCKEAGLDKQRLTITNLVCCQLPEDREPTLFEIQCCHERLKQEIHTAQPDLIVALGGPCARTLTGSTHKITSVRGTLIPLVLDFNYPCQVLITLHPSFVMRQRHWIPTAIKDYQLAVEVIQGRINIEETPNPEFILDPSDYELQTYLSQIKEDDLLVFDIETTGLNPRKDEVLGIAFCYEPSKAVAIKLFDNDPRWEIVSKVLTDKQVKKCAQNGSYDHKMLYPLGINVNPIAFDTRLAETLLQSDMPKDLQALRAAYTNIPPYKPSKKEMKIVGTWNTEKLLTIGCWDAFTTYMVMLKQIQNLTPKERHLKDTLLLPLIPVFEHMERKGMAVDVDRLAGLYSKSFPHIEELSKEFDTIGVNPASPKQICSHFKLRDSNEETLKWHINRGHKDSEWFEKILAYRGAAKGASTYLAGIYNRLENGRIHTEYKIEGTGTGRPSSSNPNLANVPNFYRQIYIADPNSQLCEVDANQLELRIGALLAPEPLLLNELLSGQDIHENLRKIIFGDPEQPRQRTQTKGVVFGTLFGESPRTLAVKFGITIATAQEWQALCINRFPGLLKYKKRCESDVINKGYVETPFGRRRYISSLTQGYNTPIQSSAGDVGLTMLLRLYQAGLDVRITVYDSFLCNITRGYDEAMYMKQICEAPFDIFGGYCFPVKAAIGSNWYELELINGQTL